MSNWYRLSRYDLLLIVVSVLLCILLPFILTYASSPSRQAKVVEHGRIIKEVELSGESIVSLHLGKGDMTLEIKEGKIRVKNCFCPQKICVLTGWVSGAGQSIVCVPNKVLVEIEGTGNTEAEYDAITY